MLLDSQNLFSDKQAITAGETDSTNTVKFAQGDISFLPVIIQAVEGFSDLTSLTVKIITSNDESFSEAKTLVESTLTRDELTQGAKFPICHMPKGNLGYIKLTYTPEGAQETTGAITAGICASYDINNY